MTDFIYVSFEDNGDTSTLYIYRGNKILNVITGKRAKKIYETLAKSREDENKEQLPGQLSITDFIGES